MSTYADAEAVEGGVHRMLHNLFALSTVLFILGGAAIVLIQLVLILTAQGTAARDFVDVLEPYVFGTSSVAGLLAFVLSYFTKRANLDGE